MKKLLIIDDEKDNLTSITALLRNYLPSCETLTAQSGAEGIKIAKSENPDAILLDIIMPKMDGYEVCKRLKEDESTKHIPIVMITAIMTDPESRIKGLELGADAFLAKPIDPTELIAQIKVMFRIKEAEDKLRAEKEELEEVVTGRTFELKESEEKYKALYDNAPLSYQALNEDGSFIDVNPAWLNTLGYKREEVIGKFYADFLHPDWKPHFDKNFPAFKKQGYINDVQFKIKHKDGHYLDISFEGSIGYHPDGRFRQTYCVFHDITDRKQAEENVRKNQQKLQILSETAMKFVEFPKDKDIYQFIGLQLKKLVSKKSFIIISSIDNSTKILSVRVVLGIGKLIGKVVKLLGKRPEEVTITVKDENLKYLSDSLLHYSKKGIHELSLNTIPQTVSRSIEKIFNIGKIYTIGFISKKQLFGTAIIILKKDSRAIQDYDIIEAFIKQASIAIQKKEAEEELQQSEEKYHKFFSDDLSGAFISTPEGKLLECNQAFLDIFGYPTKKSAMKASTYKLYTDINQRDEKIQMLKKVKKLESYEEKLKNVNGEIINVVTNMRGEFDSDGILVLLKGYLVDVTKQRIAERKLQEKNRSLKMSNDLFVGRELKMIELKKEINELLERSGEKAKYRIIR